MHRSLSQGSQRPGQSAVRWARATLVVVVAGLLGLIGLPDRQRPPEPRFLRTDPWTVRVTLEGFRAAIEAYRTDHGTWPGWEACEPASARAAGAQWFERQMQEITDAAGVPSSTRDAEHRFGPYVEGGLPANPLTGRTTVRVLDPHAPLPDWTDGRFGWVYDPRSGRLWLDLPGRLGQPDVRYLR